MRMHARIYKETNKSKRTRIHEEICLYNYVYVYIYIYISFFSTRGNLLAQHLQIPEKKFPDSKRASKAERSGGKVWKHKLCELQTQQ